MGSRGAEPVGGDDQQARGDALYTLRPLELHPDCRQPF
jgi:hypothetical protein